MFQVASQLAEGGEVVDEDRFQFLVGGKEGGVVTASHALQPHDVTEHRLHLVGEDDQRILGRWRLRVVAVAIASGGWRRV